MRFLYLMIDDIIRVLARRWVEFELAMAALIAAVERALDPVGWALAVAFPPPNGRLHLVVASAVGRDQLARASSFEERRLAREPLNMPVGAGLRLAT